MRKYLCFGIGLMLFMACNLRRDKIPLTPELKKEMENRQIKKLSEAQIFAKAFELGRQIADDSQKTLAANLKSAISTKGISEAIQFCNVAAMPLVDSLSLQYQATIRRVSFRVRNPKNQPDSLEKEILEAYQANLEKMLPPQPNVQQIDDQYLLYTQPILLNNPLCLQCHGQVGNEIKKEDYDLLKKLYPQDSAINHQTGDLRGMWSIKLSKKAIINSM